MPRHLKLSQRELSFSEWILRDTNIQPKAVLHIKCLEGTWCALRIQCMLTVNVTLLFLAPPLSAHLFWWEINSYFHLSSSCLDLTVPEARGVGWMGWHFSNINPLFSQLVKISQSTHKGIAYTFFVQGVDWAVTDLWRLGLMMVSWLSFLPVGHRLFNRMTRYIVWQAETDGLALWSALFIMFI